MIHNYPGFPDGISGKELLERIRTQALKMGAEIRKGNVISMMQNMPIKTVATKRETITAKAVILATGIRRERLNIPGEGKLLGLGVSYCVICDGPLYKGRKVAVIGYGEDAISDTIFLSGIARKVYSIPLKPLPIEHIEKLKAHSRVKILREAKVKKIIGDKHVQGVEVLRGEESEIMDVDGIFVVTEETPTLKILKAAGIKVDNRGCIEVNLKQETNIEGVYVAGASTCDGMQAFTAAGQGALAAINVVAYIRSKPHL